MRTKILSAFIVLGAMAPGIAAASEVYVSYNVDVGPLTMTVVKFTIDASADAVRARAKIRSKGLSRVFSEYSATAEAETRLRGAAPLPVSFRLVREKTDKNSEVTLNFDGDGRVTYTPAIDKADRRQKVEQALGNGVTDPITAVLRMGVSGENPCPSVHEVFDGRDVYELALSDKGMGKLDGDAAYKGPVQNCEVRWTPIAGRAKDKNDPGDSYEVAFAPVGMISGDRKLWLPVWMSGLLKGLRFQAYATELKSDGGTAAPGQN